MFGGFQKNSLIDYPDRISSVIFLSGCNFHCPYCHNPSLINPFDFIPEKVVFDFLESRQKQIEGVVLSGGEPTLNCNLIRTIVALNDLGYEIKLDTNGSMPLMIALLLDENMLTYVAMDIKTDPWHYNQFVSYGINPNRIVESINIIKKSKINYEFRTTCVKPIINIDVMHNIGKLIKGAKRYVLQRFIYSKDILNPDFFNDGSHFADQELLELKSIAEQYVEECIIR